jgi:o-succinylbenzoate synthase
MPLNISNIRLSVVRLDLVHDFETSSHRKSYLDHILVRVTTPDGLIGWGECASPSGPFYCGETTQTCWYVLHDHLGPALLGREWQHPAEAATMMAHVSGNNFARAGLEMACWDLYGKSRGRSLSDVLGVTSQFVDAGVSLGIEAGVDALLEQVRSHVDEGYRRVKLKIRPGWDVEPVRHVREAFPDLALQVDANTAYTRDDVAHLAGLDPFGLLMTSRRVPSSTSRCRGSAGSARPGRCTTNAGPTACPSGAAECTNSASVVRPTWRWPACPVSCCPLMCPGPPSITPETWSYPRSSRRTAGSPCRRHPESASKSTRASSSDARDAWWS